MDPSHQGFGHGRSLVDAVAGWASERGAEALTLTTFRDIEWNRPLYEHLGFVVVDESDLSPALVALSDHERELGLDAAGPRVVMRRALTSKDRD